MTTIRRTPRMRLRLRKEAQVTLRDLLQYKQELSMQKLRINYYSFNNISGALLARSLKRQTSKARIPFLLHCTTGEKIKDPQKFADEFSVLIWHVVQSSERPEHSPTLASTNRQFFSKSPTSTAHSTTGPNITNID